MPMSRRLHNIAYRTLKDWPTRLYPWSASIREQLIISGLGVSHVVYISSMFFWTIISIVASLAISITLFSVIFPMIGIYSNKFTIVLAEVFFPVLIGFIILTIFQMYPKYKASLLNTEINKNLVYITNFMNILTGAGGTTEEVFISLARVGEVYSIKRSSRTIIRDIELLGLDILSALDEESKRVPSQEYSDLLQGYISTITVGGDMGTYLTAMAKQFLESRKRTLSQMIEKLNLAGEIFIATLIAFPVIMITLLSIMGFFGGQAIGSLNPQQVMMIMVYVLIPMTATAVLVIIDSMMSSW